MRRRKTRDTTVFSLSFLDAISCGFGAIVMLLVLTKIGEPIIIEEVKEELEARVALLEEELFQIRGETDVLNRTMTARLTQVSDYEALIARLRGDMTDLEGEFKASRQLSETQSIIEGRLMAAQQELTDEMKRLLGYEFKREETDQTIGGIPVDSEYIIFVIDTSGSMYTNSWNLVVRKMREVLDIYPQVKGIQVMNDMGQYMFSSYSRKWIPDTPSRRGAILNRLKAWNVFSNSSPVEGITRAIRTFAKDDKKISIYVFGDEFTGNSIEAVLQAVEKSNHRDAEGRPLVRIHAVGFPVIFQIQGVSEQTGIRFATLMRLLCYENGGSFVGLNSIR